MVKFEKDKTVAIQMVLNLMSNFIKNCKIKSFAKLETNFSSSIPPEPQRDQEVPSPKAMPGAMELLFRPGAQKRWLGSE